MRLINRFGKVFQLRETIFHPETLFIIAGPEELGIQLCTRFIPGPATFGLHEAPH